MKASMDSQGRIYIPAEIKSKRFELTIEGDKIILRPIKKKIDEYYDIVSVDEHLSIEEIEKKAKELTTKVVS